MTQKTKSAHLLFASGLIGLVLIGPSVARAQLAVTIQNGYNVSYDANSYTFPANTATVTGGSGSYTYYWSDMNDGIYRWSSGGTGQSYAPTVHGGVTCDFSTAYYSVLVTDTVTGKQAISNVAEYDYDLRPKPGGYCD